MGQNRHQDPLSFYNVSTGGQFVHRRYQSMRTVRPEQTEFSKTPNFMKFRDLKKFSIK